MQGCPSLLLLPLLLGVALAAPLLADSESKDGVAESLCPRGWHLEVEGSRCVVEVPECLHRASLRQLARYCRYVQQGRLSLTRDGIICVTDIKPQLRSRPASEDLSDRVMKRVFGNMGLGL